MIPAPIIITVYNRFEHFQKCVESLLLSPLACDSVLFVSSDAAYKNDHNEIINEIRSYVLSIKGFKKVIPIFQERNKGLHLCYNNVINEVYKISDRFIFLEDDVLVSKYFLEFMNMGLSFYEHDSSVMSISAFSHTFFFNYDKSKNQNVYFTNRWCPWGFATWKNKFNKLSILDYNEFDKLMNDKKFVNKINTIGIDLFSVFKNMQYVNKLPSMDLLYCLNMVKNNWVTCTPYQTQSFNIGNDGMGTRTKKNKYFIDVDFKDLFLINRIEFSRFEINKIDNSFNYKMNYTIKNIMKQLLVYSGLISIAYDLNQKWKLLKK